MQTATKIKKNLYLYHYTQNINTPLKLKSKPYLVIAERWVFTRCDKVQTDAYIHPFQVACILKYPF